MTTQHDRERIEKNKEERDFLIGQLKNSIENDLQSLKDIAGGAEADQFIRDVLERIKLPF